MEKTEYIPRNIAISELIPICKSASFRNRNVFATARRCLEAIENVPTADVVERKRGRWKGAGFGDYYCSWCNSTYSIGAERLDLYNFCPNCGADMREDNNG